MRSEKRSEKLEVGARIERGDLMREEENSHFSFLTSWPTSHLQLPHIRLGRL